jgi:hypothetical protein
MPFGMEEQAIESRAIEKLRQRPGHIARFNNYQIDAIAKAIASAIIENNSKIEHSLGETVDSGANWVDEILNTLAQLTGQSADTLREKVILAGLGIRVAEPVRENIQLLGRIDELTYTNSSDRYRHEFNEPKPLLIKLPNGTLFLLRGESNYNVTLNSHGRWEVIG